MQINARIYSNSFLTAYFVRVDTVTYDIYWFAGTSLASTPNTSEYPSSVFPWQLDSFRQQLAAPIPRYPQLMSAKEMQACIDKLTEENRKLTDENRKLKEELGRERNLHISKLIFEDHSEAYSLCFYIILVTWCLLSLLVNLVLFNLNTVHWGRCIKDTWPSPKRAMIMYLQTGWQLMSRSVMVSYTCM